MSQEIPQFVSSDKKIRFNKRMNERVSMNRKQKKCKVQDSPRMRTYQCKALDTNRIHQSSCANLISFQR